MNLRLVHKLLTAANEQPYGFLKVRGADLAHEVELMAAAGLVEASETVRDLETFSVINRLTDAGYSFLRAFRREPPLPSSVQRVQCQTPKAMAKNGWFGLISPGSTQSLRYFLEQKCETRSRP
jgi:hypothetical protein